MTGFPQYRSPLSLLEMAGKQTSYFSENDRTATIEFILNKGADFEYRGCVWTKEAALQAMGALNRDNFSHHSVIFQYPGLHQFLEAGKFVPEELEKAYSFHYKPAFVNFVSEFYSPSFKALVSAYLATKDFGSLNQLLDFAGFILPFHLKEAFSPLQEDLQSLEDNLDDRGEQQENRFWFLTDAWISLANKLPVHLQPLRESILTRVLSILKDNRHKLNYSYAEAVLVRLKKLKASEKVKSEISLFEDEISYNAPVQVPSGRTRRAVIGILSFSLIMLAVAIVFNRSRSSKPKEITPPSVMPLAVTESPVSDHLASSTNESNLKMAFYELVRMLNEGAVLEGEEMKLQTGTSPLGELSKLPQEGGSCELTVRNESELDAMMLCFTSDNLIINSRSKFYAVYIRSGETLVMPYRPNYGRLNFVFGKKWMQLYRPLEMPVATGNSGSRGEDFRNNDERFSIGYFFGKPAPEQFLLNHNITIQNFQESESRTNGVPSSTALNLPSDEEIYRDENPRITIYLKGKTDIRAKADGTLYVYLSPPRF